MVTLIAGILFLFCALAWMIEAYRVYSLSVESVFYYIVGVFGILGSLYLVISSWGF